MQSPRCPRAAARGTASRCPRRCGAGPVVPSARGCQGSAAIAPSSISAARTSTPARPRRTVRPPRPHRQNRPTPTTSPIDQRGSKPPARRTARGPSPSMSRRPRETPKCLRTCCSSQFAASAALSSTSSRRLTGAKRPRLVSRRRALSGHRNTTAPVLFRRKSNRAITHRRRQRQPNVHPRKPSLVRKHARHSSRRKPRQPGHGRFHGRQRGRLPPQHCVDRYRSYIAIHIPRTGPQPALPSGFASAVPQQQARVRKRACPRARPLTSERARTWARVPRTSLRADSIRPNPLPRQRQPAGRSAATRPRPICIANRPNRRGSQRRSRQSLRRPGRCQQHRIIRVHPRLSAEDHFAAARSTNSRGTPETIRSRGAGKGITRMNADAHGCHVPVRSIAGPSCSRRLCHRVRTWVAANSHAVCLRAISPRELTPQ